jgi:ABC-type Fe3+-siderophore transport system permease subunit
MNFSVSSLFFDLALLFIPGFIWMKIHARYGPKIERTQFDLFLNAFIFGVLSYAILYLIYWFKGWNLRVGDR